MRATWRTVLLGSHYGIPTRRKRPQFTDRVITDQLGVPSARYWAQGHRYSIGLRHNALRHMSIDVLAREMPSTT